jgi:hypothetical protein
LLSKTWTNKNLRFLEKSKNKNTNKGIDFAEGEFLQEDYTFLNGK